MDSFTTDEIHRLVADYNAMPGVNVDHLVHTETRLGEPLAIIDSWQFGGHWEQWDDTNPLIVVDATIWNGLSDTARDYLVAHEKHERNAAREAGDAAGDDLPPGEIVDRYHNEANRRAVAEIGEEAATRYAQEIYELAVANPDNDHPCWQATYVLRGVESLVPDDLRIDLPATLY